MPSVTVKLSKPIEFFGKRLAAVTLKEPTGGPFVRLGEPRVLIFTPTGSGYWIENAEQIRSYLDALIDHEAGGEAIMSSLGLEDAIIVKEALFDFFIVAAANANAKRAAAKSTPSSSASGL
jgi:hypothetical protein